MVAIPWYPGATATIVPPSEDPTGVGDLAAVQYAFSLGPVVVLMPGLYNFINPVVVPSGGILTGSDRETIVSAAPGFSGAAVVTMPGTTYSEVSRMQINANNLTDGIQFQSAVNPHVYNIDMENPINGFSASGTTPKTIRARKIVVHQATGIGYTSGGTDSTWLDCTALGCAAQGWFIGNGNANTKFIGCRSEFSGTYGFQISGAWNTGTGSGGPQFIGCSTDRNGRSGFFVSATGTTPILFTNTSCRRDGSTSLTQYAGFEVSAATIPISIVGLQVFPGVNDDGSGNLSPWSGFNASGSPTYVMVDSAFLHGATNGINGSAPFGLTTYRNISTRTGPTSTPSAITNLADSA